MRLYSHRNLHLDFENVTNSPRNCSLLKGTRDLSETAKHSQVREEPMVSSHLLSEEETAHYIRIPVEDLSSQLSTYDWRAKTQDNIIPIQNFELISSETDLKSHALVKVVVKSRNQ